MFRMRLSVVVVALAATTALALEGVALAKPIERGTFHDEFTDVGCEPLVGEADLHGPARRHRAVGVKQTG